MEKMSEIRYGGGGVPYAGPTAEPKEEKVEEKPEPEATVSVTETETDAEEISELEIVPKFLQHLFLFL